MIHSISSDLLVLTYTSKRISDTRIQIYGLPERAHNDTASQKNDTQHAGGNTIQYSTSYVDIESMSRKNVYLVTRHLLSVKQT